jgi:hypothetical protein
VRSELTDDDVRTAIKNSGGIKGSLLIPEAPFELLVRRAIECLLPPALQCKDFVHGELLRIASQCAPPEVRRFQILGVSDTEAVGRLRSFQVLGVLQQKRGTVGEILGWWRGWGQCRAEHAGQCTICCFCPTCLPEPACLNRPA